MKIAIEITSLCNYNCGICPFHNLSIDKGTMSFDDFKKIVNGLLPETEEIMLFNRGEPLVHNRIVDMVRYVKDKGIKTLIATNGAFLNVNLINNLYNAGIDRIVVSFHGPTKETYKAVMKSDGFGKVRDVVKILYEKKPDNVIVDIKMVVTKYTDSLKEEMQKLFLEMKGDKEGILFFQDLNLPTQDLNDEELQPFVDEFFTTDECRRYDYDVEENGKIKIKMRDLKECRQPWETPVIRWDGNVVICCHDSYGKKCYGNAIVYPFSKIWDSEIYKQDRELGIKRSLEICKRCALI